MYIMIISYQIEIFHGRMEMLAKMVDFLFGREKLLNWKEILWCDVIFTNVEFCSVFSFKSLGKF